MSTISSPPPLFFTRPRFSQVQVAHPLPNRLNGVAIFGSASYGPSTPQYQQMQQLAEKLAHAKRHGKPLFIVTGGCHGLAEAAAKGFKAAGGHTEAAGMLITQQGLPPKTLYDNTVMHHSLNSRIYGEGGFHNRAAMTLIGEGGMGTLQEIINTFLDIYYQKSSEPMQKQLVIFDPNGYYKKSLLPLLNFMVKTKTAQPDILDYFTFAKTPDEAIAALTNAQVGYTQPHRPQVDKVA